MTIIMTLYGFVKKLIFQEVWKTCTLALNRYDLQSRQRKLLFRFFRYFGISLVIDFMDVIILIF